jgi:Family of unknown function (DUF5946)
LPASMRCRDLYNELLAYTLERRDEDFIHQHAVDAYVVQHAEENSKPIATAAGLIGLYLFAEKNRSGRDVQRAHTRLGNRMKAWPGLPAPRERASINVATVLSAPPGPERDRAIKEWARAVWATWRAEHARIRDLLERSEAAGRRWRECSESPGRVRGWIVRADWCDRAMVGPRCRPIRSVQWSLVPLAA